MNRANISLDLTESLIDLHGGNNLHGTTDKHSHATVRRVYLDSHIGVPTSPLNKMDINPALPWSPVFKDYMTTTSASSQAATMRSHPHLECPKPQSMSD
jgi:hypothetical protein